jgi:hypothetical protein
LPRKYAENSFPAVETIRIWAPGIVIMAGFSACSIVASRCAHASSITLMCRVSPWSDASVPDASMIMDPLRNTNASDP